MHVDHRFPYALGGPSDPSNAIFLCREHNLLKGHDVHLNKWVPEEFLWLDSLIDEVKHLRTP